MPLRAKRLIFEGEREQSIGMKGFGGKVTRE